MRLFDFIDSRHPKNSDFESLTDHEAERAALARAAVACDTDCPKIDYPNVIDARDRFGGIDDNPIKDLGSLAVREEPISHVRIIGPVPSDGVSSGNNAV